MSQNITQRQIELLFKAKTDTDTAMNQVASQLKQLKATSTDTGTSMQSSLGKGEEGLRSLVHTGNIAGVGMRDFRHITMGATAGLEMAFSSVGAAAETKMGGGIASAVRKSGELASAFIFLGPVGAAIAAVGLAFGYVQSQIAEAEQRVKDAAKPFEDLRKEIESLTELRGIAKMAQDLGVSENALKKYIAETKAGAQSSTAYSNAQESVAVMQTMLAEKTEWLTKLQSPLVRGLLVASHGYSTLNDEIAKTEHEIVGLQAGIITAAAAENSLAPSITAATQAFAEQQRKLNIMQTAVPQMAEAWKSYQQQLSDLGTQHSKTTKALEEERTLDIAKEAREELKLTQDITRQEATTRKSYIDRSIEEQYNYNRQVVEQAYSTDRQLREMAYSRSQQIKELAYNEMLQARQMALEKQKLEQQTTEEIRGIKENAMEQEAEASSWTDVQRIRRQTARQIEQTQSSANNRQKDLQEQKSQQEETHKHQIELMEEQDQHQRDLLDEQNRHQKELMDEQAAHQAQIADQEEKKTLAAIQATEAERRSELQQSLQEQLTAIEKRKDEENKSYAESAEKAKRSYTEQINKLGDLRDDVHKFADSWNAVKNQIDDTTRRSIYLSGVLAQMKVSDLTFGVPYWDTEHGGGWQRGYQEGGHFIAIRPQTIHVGEGYHPEEVSIVPLNKRGQAGGGLNIVIQGNVYGDSHLRQIANQIYDQMDRATLRSY